MRDYPLPLAHRPAAHRAAPHRDPHAVRPQRRQGRRRERRDRHPGGHRQRGPGRPGRRRAPHPLRSDPPRVDPRRPSTPWRPIDRRARSHRRRRSGRAAPGLGGRARPARVGVRRPRPGAVPPSRSTPPGGSGKRSSPPSTPPGPASCPTCGATASSVLRGPFTVEGYVADALAVLDGLGVERAHVVGGSLGGSLAVALAATAPDRVASVAAFGSLLSLPSHQGRTRDRGPDDPGARHPGLLRGDRPRDPRARPPDRQDAHRPDRGPVGGPGRTPEMVTGILLNALRCDIVDQAEAVRCPSLVVTGEHDAWCSAGGRAGPWPRPSAPTTTSSPTSATWPCSKPRARSPRSLADHFGAADVRPKGEHRASESHLHRVRRPGLEPPRGQGRRGGRLRRRLVRRAHLHARRDRAGHGLPVRHRTDRGRGRRAVHRRAPPRPDGDGAGVDGRARPRAGPGRGRPRRPRDGGQAGQEDHQADRRDNPARPVAARGAGRPRPQLRTAGLQVRAVQAQPDGARRRRST